MILSDREETLEQVLNTPWHFDCPVHGAQREIPLDAKEQGRFPRQNPEPMGLKIGQRRSKRFPLRVPVLIYGRERQKNAFREKTFTLVVNAHGGLVALTPKVKLGDTVVLVNKATQEEQECRVAYLGPEVEGKNKVGVAFKPPSSNFWQTDFLSDRPTRCIERL